VIAARVKAPRDYYRDRNLLSTLVFVIGGLAIALVWGRLVPHYSTFFGLIGAGVAVTYTRMLEIGKWIHGDQYTGRILQFPNAQIFGAGVFNYTRDFEYIWDEVSLNISYSSNVDSATKIMLSAGQPIYERLPGAALESSCGGLQQYFLVPDFELEPQVYVHVPTNWIGLRMRYVVDPRNDDLLRHIYIAPCLTQVIARDDIEIGTDTMESLIASVALASRGPKAERLGTAPRIARRPPASPRPTLAN
jgi:hypothetical protein